MVRFTLPLNGPAFCENASGAGFGGTLAPGSRLSTCAFESTACAGKGAVRQAMSLGRGWYSAGLLGTLNCTPWGVRTTGMVCGAAGKPVSTASEITTCKLGSPNPSPTIVTTSPAAAAVGCRSSSTAPKLLEP